MYCVNNNYKIKYRAYIFTHNQMEYFYFFKFVKFHFYTCTLAPMQRYRESTASPARRWHARNSTFQYRSVSRRSALQRVVSVRINASRE